MSSSQPTASQTDQEHEEHADVVMKPKVLSFLSPDISAYFIAGGVAGAASRTVVSPLERLKIIQ
jgi:solute carrier family 25 phosphate transporter 23/24/25/41